MNLLDQILAHVQQEKNKRPLVLFSGGWDSTFLLNWMCQWMDCDTLYVYANGGPLKNERERHARRGIIDFIREHPPGDTPHEPLEDHVAQLDEIWIKAKRYQMVQPISWLSAALIHFDPDIHCGVAVGYLLGDQAPAYREQLQAFWQSGWALLRGASSSAPPLWFPLLDMGYTKDAIVRDIKRELAALAWVCETPRYKSHDGVSTDSETNRLYSNVEESPEIKNISACGRCKPCRLLRHTLDDWQEDNPNQDYWARDRVLLLDTSDKKDDSLESIKDESEAAVIA